MTRVDRYFMYLWIAVVLTAFGQSYNPNYVHYSPNDPTVPVHIAWRTA